MNPLDMHFVIRWAPVIGGLGLLLACIAAASLPAIMLIPQLSAEWFVRLRPARAFIGPAGAALSAASVALAPSALTWTLFALSLPPAIASVLMWPHKVIVALGRLHHAPSAEASLANDAQIIACDEEGQRVAWPLESIVIPYHLVNDVVGERPVLVSWCHACRSGLLWDPMVDGRRLTFEVTGVFRRNLVMQDRETGSIWQQAEGSAIAGPLLGKHLALLASQQVTWGAWREAHDDARLALLPEQAPRGLIPKSRLMKMLTVTDWLNTPGTQRADERLPQREVVIGVEVDGVSYAFPLAALQAAGRVVQRFGAREVELMVAPGTEFLRVRDVATGNAVPYEKHWWLGWREFHPFTNVWTPQLEKSG